MQKRARKRGRPRTGHDPMVGVRLPPKMLKKIARVADVLGADRSTAIRSILEYGLDLGRVIGLLRSGKGRGQTGEIAMAIMAQFKASRAAEHATRAAPAKRSQAEIKALRAAEDAVDRLSSIGDRLALKQTHKPSKSEATWIEPNPPAPSVECTKLVVRKAPPRPLQKRKLSEAEVQEIVERAISRSEEKHGPAKLATGQQPPDRGCHASVEQTRSQAATIVSAGPPRYELDLEVDDTLNGLDEVQHRKNRGITAIELAQAPPSRR